MGHSQNEKPPHIIETATIFGGAFLISALAYLMSFLSGGVFCLVYSFSEYWKLVARDDPIYAEDLTLIKEALQMSESYIEVTWQMCLAVALVVIGTLVMFLFFRGKPHTSNF